MNNSIKHTSIVACLIGVLALSANVQIRNGRASRTNTSASPTQDQGQREANRFWSKYVALCGGAYYVKRGPRVVVQLRGYEVHINYYPVTEADRLNGIQVKGRASFTSRAYRYYQRSAWQPWGDGLPVDLQMVNSVNFSKVGGRWLFQPIGIYREFPPPISCADLPWASSSNETPSNVIEITDDHLRPILEFSVWDPNTNEAATRFGQSMTTFINWRIRYDDVGFNYGLSNVESYWFKDGAQWSYDGAAHVSRSAGEGLIWAGKGWEEPGHWELGSYKVKIFLRKRLVAVGNFEIVPEDQLPKELRFDGLYRSQPTGDNQYDWLRFYENGTVLLGIGLPSNARLDICISSERNKYAEGCDKYKYRMGRYRLSGKLLSFSWLPEDSPGVLVNVTGTVGHNMLRLDYDLPTANVSYKNRLSTFVNVGRLY